MSPDDAEPSQIDRQPSGFQVRFDRLQDPNEARPTTLMVSHPATPFVRHTSSEPDEGLLQSMALDYLNHLEGIIGEAETRDRLGLPDEFDVPGRLNQGILDSTMGWPSDWLPSLNTTDESSSFRWAPFNPTVPKDGLISLASSIDARRHEGEQNETRTAVLLATEFDGAKFLDSGFGLYVIAHISADDDGFQTRITGMRAVSPSGRFLSEPEPLDGVRPDLFTIDELIVELDPEVERRLQLQGLTFRKARLFSGGEGEGKNRFELRGSGGSRVSSGRPIPFEFVVEGIREKEGFRITRIRKSSLVVNATPGKADLFHQDPMSSQTNPDASDRGRRPTRSEETLNAYRVERGTFPDPLEDPNGEFRIELSQFVKADLDTISSGNPKSVPLPGGDLPAIRSNDFAAVSAYYNTQQFFGRMHLYGIAPTDMFKQATLPLHVYYRSGAAKGPGKDGQTVNAEVRPREPADVLPRIIEVHLMLANQSHRARSRWDGQNRSEAEPLGIAAASRWMWHEFGHVLLLAATGEKEFEFAHSAGDALAAIVADPHSRFSEREVDEGRGVTFPWSFLTRRHDRCVLNGWAWGGTLDPLSRLPDGTVIGDIKAYQAEQILSTSLFRLYRCLGGDTVQVLSDGSQKPDRDARETAAHYAIFLVMDAIRLLALPAHGVKDFVFQLRRIDEGVSAPFAVTLESGATSLPRMGGSASKLIRWAFEAQGLYQHGATAGSIINAPGDPDDVDVYIADNRPLSEKTEAGMVTYETPGYVPVSLDWTSNDPNPPAWHAHEDAIQFDGTELRVAIDNRGRDTAVQVRVRVWSTPVPADLDGVMWNDSSVTVWTELDAAVIPPQDVPPGSVVTFGPFQNLPTAAGDYLIFAEATCDDDKANTDTTTSLPCSTQPTRIVDLVAGDNNLGLRRITI